MSKIQNFLLDSSIIEKTNNIIVEAPEDEEDTSQDEVDDNTDESTDEPMEDEAGFGSDDNEETSDDSDEGDPLLDGENQAEQNNEEDDKKIKLFEDYEELLETSERLKKSLEKLIPIKNDRDEKNVSIVVILDENLKDTIKSLKFAMTKSFKSFTYKKLLTIFLYLKGSVEQINKILEKISKDNE